MWRSNWSLEKVQDRDEPKFLSENVVLYSLEKKPKLHFIFPRSQRTGREGAGGGRCRNG